MTTATRIRATLVRTSRDERTHARLPDETVEIEAEDEDGLLALFFREYRNRYKYCSTVHYAFEDDAWNKRFVAWIADVGNYMRAGGDMW